MTKTPKRREGRRAPLDRFRLRSERMRAGLNQKQLAELSGVSQSQISALECGENGASPETVARLAAALRCTVDDLFIRRSA